MKQFGILSLLSMWLLGHAQAADLNLPTRPIFVQGQVAPLVMLVMGRDHTLYYEAYNDATDLDGNGAIDEDETRYAPTVRDYYGYFDSYKCYSYASSGVFVPTGTTDDKTCNGKGGDGRWSGDFLNYLTTSRIDALRKVLYGGYRGSDNEDHPILQRSMIPRDAHVWGKTWDPKVMNDSTAGNLLVSSYAPLLDTKVYFFANTSLSYSGWPLLRVLETIQNPSPTLYIWNWVTRESTQGGSAGDYMDGYTDNWGNLKSIASARTDYVVRVQVCTDGMLENNCKKYGTSTADNKYKPVGLLQNYGEGDDPKMEFGLITGSFNKNLSGGVLRAKVGKLQEEINSSTGQFKTRGSTGTGIISTLNQLRITDFNFSNLQYGCGWATSGPISEGQCPDWGNPIGEMLFESLRYFAGAKAATSDFSVPSDGALALKQDRWDDPYESHNYCAKPINLVISDTGVSYDSDQIPGSAFNSYRDNTLSDLNVSHWTATISEKEGLNGGLFYIGEVLGQTEGKNAPTAKTITSLAQVRGLSPEEPTKMGSFYSAGVAYYGHETDLRSDIGGDQKTNTIVVALASKLPQIKINAGDKTITLIPYAKSVGGSVDGTKGRFQPTNGIVDFYVESLSETEGTFRVNYEDVEQGADHDMDYVVKYHYVVNSNNTVTITLTSDYAYGGIHQHAGYVISGTEGMDGLYLDVSDKYVDRTQGGADTTYYLDTPDPSSNTARESLATNNSYKTQYLPNSRTRTFTPSSTNTAASLLKSPLWYAAKWGAFDDKNSNGVPDNGEWDANSSGTPDNYFLVTNASNLESQLEEAFNAASEDDRSASAVSFSGYQLSNDSQAFLASFEAKTWSGDLQAYAVTSGAIATSPSWSAAAKLDARSSISDRVIITWDGTSKRLFSQPSSLSGSTSGLSSDMIDELLTGISGSSANKLSYVQALVDYLRGDRTDEAGGVQVPIVKTNFRPRSSRLGDIVHSTPVYGESVDGVPFVVVSANDGMVHVFNADDGEEILAFVPHGIYDKLNKLADINYDSAHQFFVDGEIKVSSITDDDGDKRVIAVGTFGLGAKGAWALDLSNLSSVRNTLSTADKILWEVDSLGYVPYPPAIAKVQDGGNQRWVAAFGNGYNDGTTAGNSSIKVYDLLSGSLLKTLTSPKGKSDDPTGQSRPNGMAEPVFADSDLNGVADRLYAGDLFGYLWKIDVNKDNISDWDFAIKSGSVITPLFITQLPTGTTPAYEPQPITTRPAVAFHPTGGLMVLVGTGKYLEASDTDVSDQVTQSLYGLWDNGANDTIARTNLVKQEITAQAAHRTLSNNSIDWSTKQGWYLDLINPNTDSNEGERIVNNITVRNTKASLTTLIPNEDLCSGGGTGWYMEINLLTGDNQGLEENSELLEKIPSKPVTKLVTTDDGDVEVSNSVRLDGEDELFESTPTVERTGAVSWLKVY